MTSAPGNSLLLKTKELLETPFALKPEISMVLQVEPWRIFTCDGTWVFLLMVIYISATLRFWLLATRCT